MQLRASALPPNLTRNLEAKIDGQTYEIQTPQRDLQTTRDSLNSWDEVNLTSIQDVFVHERVATSTSSVSRITEPAISHLPQPGGDPELFLQREHSMPKAASKLSAGPSTPPSSISKTPAAILLFRRLFLPTGSTEATVTAPDYGGFNKRVAEAIVIDKWASPTEFRS